MIAFNMQHRLLIQRYTEYLTFAFPTPTPHYVVQSGKEISVIIASYVIRNQKVIFTTFFLFQHFTNYLSLKLRTNGNIERLRALLWDCKGINI